MTIFTRSLLISATLGVFLTSLPLLAQAADGSDTCLAQAAASDGVKDSQATHDRTSATSSKKRSKKKNARTAKSRKYEEGEREVNFLNSEDAFWNARTVNDPAFRGGDSVNSVMFESRPGRDIRYKKLENLHGESEIEFTGGGNNPEITVDGKTVDQQTKDKAVDRQMKDYQKGKQGYEKQSQKRRQIREKVKKEYNIK